MSVSVRRPRRAEPKVKLSCPGGKQTTMALYKDDGRTLQANVLGMW